MSIQFISEADERAMKIDMQNKTIEGLLKANEEFYKENAELKAKAAMQQQGTIAEAKALLEKEGFQVINIGHVNAVGMINNQIQEIGELYRTIKQLKEQLAEQEDRNDVIMELLTESQLHELKKMDDEDDSDDDEDEDEEIACANCGDLGLKSDFNEGITKQGPKLYCKDCLEDPDDESEAEEEEEEDMVPYSCIDDYIWGRVKDICREENLSDHFCPVAITNELQSAIKLKAKVAELTADHQTLKLQTNEQADIITRQNAEIIDLKKQMTCDFCKKQGERTDMLLSCRTCCTVIFSKIPGWNVVAEGK